jgi:hypothetical protein
MRDVVYVGPNDQKMEFDGVGEQEEREAKGRARQRHHYDDPGTGPSHAPLREEMTTMDRDMDDL